MICLARITAAVASLTLIRGAAATGSNGSDACTTFHGSRRAFENSRHRGSTSMVLTRARTSGANSAIRASPSALEEAAEAACRAFAEESSVTFTVIPGERESLEAVLPEKEDYSCLLAPPLVRRDKIRRYKGHADTAGVVSFVNSIAGTHRLPSGERTPFGEAVSSVAASLFTPPETEGGGVCDAVPVESMSRQRFLSDFVLRNRPVLLKGAARHWPALQRWTTGYLRNASGDMKVRSARRR